MGLLSDEPEDKHDSLGHGTFLTRLAVELRACKPPYVLGLHGDWGTGKTSALLKLKDALASGSVGKRARIVFFEAWQYQFEANPAVALLHVLRDHFMLDRKLWDEAGKLGEVAVYTGLSLLGDIAKAIPGFGALPGGIAASGRAEGERYEAANLQTPLAADTMRSMFQQAIKSLVGKDGRLYVLVDDLDRCSDEAVVRLLESLKLYLRADNCVFVVAADKRAIVRAFQRRLFEEKDLANTSTRLQAEEYTGKLFQAVAEIPVVASLAPFIQHVWPADAPSVVPLVEEHKLLPHNPRKVKRYLSELSLRKTEFVANYPAAIMDWQALVAVQALQTFHPDIYRILVVDPSLWQELVSLAAFTPTPRTPERAVDKLLKDLKVPRTAQPDWFDPGDAQVLRVAPLLAQLNTLEEGDLRRYLLSAPPEA